jgi:hypothetical protein
MLLHNVIPVQAFKEINRKRMDIHQSIGSHRNIQSHSYSADIDIYDIILDPFTRDAKRKKKKE